MSSRHKRHKLQTVNILRSQQLDEQSDNQKTNRIEVLTKTIDQFSETTRIKLSLSPSFQTTIKDKEIQYNILLKLEN
jgi:hypothetical protein